MSEDDVKALAGMAGIVIDPAHMPGVIRNLEILLTQAGILAQAPLDPVVEPAPVFPA